MDPVEKTPMIDGQADLIVIMSLHACVIRKNNGKF